MQLDDLATAARGSGLTIHEADGWHDRHHGPMTAVKGVVLHHTGSSATGAWTVVRDGRAGLAGPLAQMTLNRDGSVTVLSDGECWHAGTGSWPSIGRNVGNTYCLGIECVYNGADITDAQRAAYPRLVAALCRHYRIPVGNVIAHREWAPDRKVDPGRIDMPALRREVQALVNAPGAAPTPAPASTPAAGGRPALHEGDVSELVWRVQTFMNRAFGSYSHIDAGSGPTSRLGPQTIAVLTEFQRRVGIPTAPPFELGPKTWAQLERYGFR